MPYVAPSTVTSGQTYTAAAHNVIVEDVIDHEARIVTANSTANTANTAVNTLTTTFNATNPTGSIIEFIGSGVAVPSGYLVCNGQAVSRTTYANLFALIGTTYGICDGTTTFNLPNILSETQPQAQLDPIQPLWTGFVGLGSANTVEAIVSPSFDNKIYIGLNSGVIVRNAVTARSVARFNEDGTLDNTYTVTANARVRAMLFDSSNQQYIFGDFTSVNATARNRAARLTGNTLDATYDPNVNGLVSCCAIQSDGKILIGGTFTTVGGAAQSYLARLNTNGTRDTGFTPSITGSEVNAILVQPDGNILIGGTFTNVAGSARTNVARLTSAGAIDSTFNATGISGGAVRAIARQSNGQILLGGNFTSYTGATVPDDFGFMVRVSSTGTLDETYKPLFNTNVRTIAIGADGLHYVGGSFSSCNGFTVMNIAKLSTSGVLDRDWFPHPSGEIIALSLDSKNRILISGSYVIIGRPASNSVGQFNSLPSYGWNRLLPTTQKTISLIKT